MKFDSFRSLKLVTLLTFIALALTAAAQEQSARTNQVATARRGRFGGPDPGVYKARLNPHWFAEDTRFWYRNDLKDGAKEFILVDAKAGTRGPAFDQQKLAAALSTA
ncbi:MAG: hypothetical protein ACREIC_33465, partial [Limisphaerales bacterium]